MMLEQVLFYLNNWFVCDIYTGKFTVEDGRINLDFLQEGQYYRIIGSVFHDGVYKYTDDLLPIDETFDGAVWALAIPVGVIEVSKKIEAWVDQYGVIINSPYTSESFSGSSYSYNKRSATSTSDEDTITWQSTFANDLAPFRKAKEVAPVKPRQQSPSYHRPFNPDYPWS